MCIFLRFTYIKEEETAAINHVEIEVSNILSRLLSIHLEVKTQAMIYANIVFSSNNFVCRKAGKYSCQNILK